jgi:hypothetical protein
MTLKNLRNSKVPRTKTPRLFRRFTYSLVCESMENSSTCLDVYMMRPFGVVMALLKLQLVTEECTYIEMA